MKRISRLGKTIGLVCLLGAFGGSGALATDFSKHPVFSKLIGKWTAEGELTVAADGTKIPLTETWEGKLNESGGLSIIGKRTMNEEEQEFSWTFSFNPTTEIFECDYEHTGMEQPLRFDVSVTPADRTVTMRTPFGDAGELVVVKKVAEDGKTVEAEVKIMDAQSQVAISGPVKHTRETAE